MINRDDSPSLRDESRGSLRSRILARSTLTASSTPSERRARHASHYLPTAESGSFLVFTSPYAEENTRKPITVGEYAG